MPITFDPTVPADSETPRLGASRIRSLTSEFLQWFGFTGLTAQTVSNPPFSVDASGNATLNGQPLAANDPVAPLGVATKEYVDNHAGAGSRGTASGTNTLIVTFSPAPSSQAALLGIPLELLNTTTNNGPVTMNVNGLGSHPVLKWSNGVLANLEVGDIQGGAYFEVIWDGTEYQLTSPDNQLRQMDSLSGTKGLTGNAPGGTTQLSLSASLIGFRPFDATGVFAQGALGSTIVDVSVSGPAAGGRDTVASFANNSTVHVYGIWNPLTASASLIASLNASAPVALPAGYTGYAYLGSFILATQNFPALYVAGDTVFFTVAQNQRFANINGGTGNTQYKYNTGATNFVPANAILARIWLSLIQQGAGVAVAQVGLLVDTSNINLGAVGTGAANIAQDDMEWTIPNLGSVYAGTSTTAGTTTFNMYILSYTNPLNQ